MKKRMRKKWSTVRQVRLQTILVVLVALVAACSVSATAICCYQTYRSSLLDRVAASRNDVLLQISTRVDLLQANMESLSRLYCNLVDDLNTEELNELFRGDYEGESSIREMMNAYQDAADVEYDVMLLDGEGCILAWPDTERDGEYDRQKELWYLNIPAELGKEEIYWTQSHRDADLQEGFYFSAARRLKNRDGEDITILLNLPERILYQSYQNIVGNNRIYIVDEKGRIISADQESLVSLNYFNMPRLDALVSSNHYTIVEKSGVKYLLSRYDNAKYNIVYLEEIPLADLLSSLGSIQKLSVLVALLAIGMACVLIWIIVHTVTSPLLALCQKLELVSYGQFDTQFDIQSWSEVSLINDVCDKMVREISSLFENIKEQEAQKRLAEIEFLQAQINPHFIHNTLFEIKCLVNLGENDEAEWMLENFMAVLRTVLRYKDEMISLGEELVILQQYFAVMQCKYGDGICLETEIPEELLSRRVLKFILQPIVENSIFHGLEPLGNKGKILVRAWEENDRLFLMVEDDGIGITAEQLQELRRNLENRDGDSVGISNVMKRIRLYFGEDYGLTIRSERYKGTQVLLTLPTQGPEPSAER